MLSYVHGWRLGLLAACLLLLIVTIYSARSAAVVADPANVLATAAGPALSCALQQSRSMHFADLGLLPFLLRSANWSTGYFVEIGALDGLSFSNTIMLERCFGWKGLLIEGSPSNFAELRRNGRLATSVHSAVCDQVGFVDFVYSGTGAKGATNGQLGHGFRHDSTKKAITGKIARVPCKPLGALMDDVSLPAVVDFLSLDVEGAEWNVIRTVDPARFRIIFVEMPGEGGNLTVPLQRVHDHIMAAGHRWARYYPDKGNRVYMHPSLAVNRCGRKCWKLKRPQHI